MKIIFLSPVGYFKGGAERSLFDLVSNPDIQPIILAPEEGPILDRARELGYETGILDFGSINNIHRPFSFIDGLKAFTDLFKAAHTLKKIAKQHGARIVHSNGLKAHMINIVSSCLFGAKSVIHIRDIPYTKPEILVWKIMHALCHRMILVSRATWPGEKLPRKAKVIHNGTSLIDEPRAPRKNEALTIGFIGRIHPAKGLHLLIDWIAESELDIRLSVRGTYSEDAPTYESEINALIVERNVQNNVTFTGFIDNAAALYAGLDIVCVPSKTPDPLPRSVMESMARGIPVLGYPAGGIVDMIENGKTGFLVKNTAEFKKAMQHIINEPNRLKSITIAAQEKISQDFTIEVLHRNIRAIYHKLDTVS